MKCLAEKGSEVKVTACKKTNLFPRGILSNLYYDDIVVYLIIV